jgi:hypothetical protein
MHLWQTFKSDTCTGRKQSMRSIVRAIQILLFALAMSGGAPTDAAAENITAAGRELASKFDSFDVEHRWIAGAHVDWQTGLPDGKAERLPGKHTHCSAFVASAAETLGVYILRPPEHGQVLLANAQNEWLASPMATAAGWRRLNDAREAQAAANRGQLVVASYHNHRDDIPGHIAIVRPSEKSDTQIAEEGPDIIQAGGHNYTSTTVKHGFANHPAAWGRNEIGYYAHDLKSEAHK